MEVEISSALLYLAIFLIAAKLGGVLAARLGQPGVFGELIAGILIGPWVAGLLSQQLLGATLCVDAESPAGGFVSILADIGIILLLFLAGLAIDVEEFKRAGKTSSLVALMGVVIAFALGFSLASLFGWTLMEAAFVGAVLAATSVGITVRTLMDVHRLHTPVGITILSAAVIDDILAIIIVSVLAGLAFGGLTFLGVAQNLALIAAFLLLVTYVGFKVLPRMLTWVGRLHVEEVTLSIALAAVFLISALAEKVRVAAITGAFIAGLVIHRAPVARALRDKVSTLGYGLFIPLFFVEMGVRTDLQALAGVSFLAVGLVAVAMFDKIAGCGLGAKLGGLGYKDSLRVGVGMMPRAEIALVIAAIGLKAGIVGPALLSMTVLVVLVTSLITPPLVKLAFRGTPPERE